MNYFAGALLLVLGVTTCGTATTVQELKQAINTHETIWTVQRSYEVTGENGKRSCVYARKTSPGVEDYRFEQGYKEGKNWFKNELLGELSQGDPDAILTVKNTKGSRGRDYTLLYWSNEKRCGILYFQDDKGKNQCELHVQESALQRQESNYPCEHEYERQCPKLDKYEVYLPSCRESAPA